MELIDEDMDFNESIISHDLSKRISQRINPLINDKGQSLRFDHELTVQCCEDKHLEFEKNEAIVPSAPTNRNPDPQTP